MKSQNLKLPLIAGLFGVLVSVGAAPLAQHTGTTNPTNEGFSASIAPGATIGPVANDFPAWGIQGGGPQVVIYRRNLTSEDLAHLATADWSLSVRVQIVQSIGSLGSNVGLFNGSEVFTLYFGVNPTGDAYVQLGAGSLAPMFVLGGAGAGYHDYQLIYEGASHTADLFVDGVERLSDLAPIGQSLPPGLEWGIGQGGVANANWNLISLEIIPEPSVIVLVLLGGVFIIVGKRRIGL